MEPQGVRWRRSGGWLGAGLAVLAALVAYVALIRAPVFRLERVTVEGNQHLSQAQVVAATGLHIGESRWRNPAEAVRQRLLDNPWVKDAEVQWHLGGELHVRILEREPLALLHYHNLYLSVDDQGHILDLVPALSGARLPLVSGVAVPPVLRGDKLSDPGLTAALDALWRLKSPWKEQVAEITTGPDTFMVMYLTGSLEGTQVKLGRADRLDEKIGVLIGLWKQAEEQKLRLQSISVENPALPSWQLRGG